MKLSITVLWRDKVSLYMFTDFLKTLFLKDQKYGVLSATLYDGEEEVQKVISEVQEGVFILCLVKETKVFNKENPTLKVLEGNSDVLIRVNPGVPENIEVLSIQEDFKESWGIINASWVQNIQRLGSS
jgi:hypothetical protein